MQFSIHVVNHIHIFYILNNTFIVQGGHYLWWHIWTRAVDCVGNVDQNLVGHVIGHVEGYKRGGLGQFRTQILALREAGFAPSEISFRFKIARQTVHRTLQCGTLNDRPRARRAVSVATPAPRKTIKKQIERNPQRSTN